MNGARRAWTFAAAAVLASVVASGCVASLPAGPPRFTAAQCRIDPGLAGMWTDSRMTQLGPGWMRFSFRCDCTYSGQARLLFAWIRERGQYRAADGRIRFERSSGAETVWPYRREGETLRLTEAADETHVYRRSGAAIACQSYGGPVCAPAPPRAVGRP